MPVYVLGGFMDIDKLVEISANYGIPLIEDNEALGSLRMESTQERLVLLVFKF